MTEHQVQIIETWNTAAAAEYRRLIDEQIEDSKARLLRIAATKPETLTGRTAVSLASSFRALEILKEKISGLNPQGQAQQ